MTPEADVHSDVEDLEKHLQMTLFGGMAYRQGDRCCWSAARSPTATRPGAVALAKQTQRLAAMTPGDPDMAAAADRARGLVERDPAALQRPPGATRPGWPGPAALPEAGQFVDRAGRSGPGHDPAQPGLRPVRRARRRRRPGPGPGPGPGPSLRAAGIQLRHWSHSDRPAFGWDSLTYTERRVTDLVAQGLSNQQVASRVFLSTHTVAFHLRHIFSKLAHHLPGPAGADHRGAGRRGFLVAINPAGSREAVAGVGPERVPHG